MNKRRAMLLVAGLGLATLISQVTIVSAQDITPVGQVTGGTGSDSSSLIAVPGGSQLVITDFSWSPRVHSGQHLNDLTEVGLSEGGKNLWLFSRSQGPQTTYVDLPLEGHWGTVLGTGLVFPPGTIVTLSVSNVPADIEWVVCWTGYLIAAAPAAIGDASSSLLIPALQQNVPNPFNPTTEIKYTLTSPGKATIRIYDAQGRLVRALVEENRSIGEHALVWDGRNDIGEALASGVYYYELLAEGVRETKKAVLLK